MVEISGNTNLAVMYFDLETTDICRPEILQIAAKYGGRPFCCYVKPQSRDPKMATHIHGFVYSNGTLFQNGVVVKTVSLMRALNLFLDFLKSIDVPCLLAGHNITFDAHILLKALISCDMTDQYRSCVYGFADTCSILITLVQNVKNHKLGTLANHFNINADRLHDALVDVRILKDVFEMAGGNDDDLINNSKTFDWYVARRKVLDKRAANMPSLEVLKDTLSRKMRENIAEAGISMGDIQNAYGSQGFDGLWNLFEEIVSREPNTMIVSEVVYRIATYLDENVENNFGSCPGGPLLYTG